VAEARPTMGRTGDVDSAYWPWGSVSPETAAPDIDQCFSRSAELHVKAPGNPLVTSFLDGARRAARAARGTGRSHLHTNACGFSAAR